MASSKIYEQQLFAAWIMALASTLAVLFIGEVLGHTTCVGGVRQMRTSL